MGIQFPSQRRDGGGIEAKLQLSKSIEITSSNFWYLQDNSITTNNHSTIIVEHGD